MELRGLLELGGLVNFTVLPPPLDGPARCCVKVDIATNKRRFKPLHKLDKMIATERKS